jgi:AraC-like DNA-binding protein
MEAEVNLHPGLRYAIKIHGTLNRENDADSGWVLECAIPWPSLGVVPRPGLALGWDISQADKDFLNGKSFAMTYYGKFQNNLCNPSEWGNLRLEKPPVSRPLLAGLLAALLGAAAGLGWLWKKRRAPGALPPVREPVRREIILAREFINNHYMEEDLDSEKISREVGLTPGYFGSLFKKETGLSFIDYLNKTRIKKAEELLLSTKQDISQIAFQVGYNNLFNFYRVFKKIRGKTPAEYRKLM